MSEITPQEDVQEAPPIPPPVPTPTRNIYGWVMMWCLFALFFYGQMREAYGPQDQKELDMVRLDSWSGGSEVSQFKLSTAGRGALGSADDSVKDLLESLKKEPLTPVRAQMELLLSKELEQPVRKEAAEYLAKANKEEAAAFTALLAGEKPKSKLKKTDEFLEKYASALGRGLRGKELVNELKVTTHLPNVALFGMAILVVGAGSLGSILFLALTAKSQPPPPNSFPARGVSKVLSDFLAYRMVAYELLFIFVPVAIAVIFGPSLYSTTAALALVCVSFVLIMQFQTPHASLPFREVIGSTKGWLRLAGIGVTGWLAVVPAMVIFAVISSYIFSFLPPPSHPVIDDLIQVKSLPAVVTIFVMTALIAPILEELTFRGTFFPALMAYMKPFTAMCVGGLVFAMIHPQGIILWLSLGSLGAMASYLYYRTGSLIPSITLHIVNNFMILMIQKVING